MASDEYVAEVYAGDAQKTVFLGGFIGASPRLILRWLRGQAHRIADGLDPAPDTTWIPARGLRRIAVPDWDAPTELRAWAADDGRQDHALQRLATGAEFEFIARDETCWYGLTARPLVIPEFTSRPGALTNA